MIVLMGRTKGVSGYMADRRPVTGGTNGGKWGIYFMGNRVNRLGNSPFSPIFSRILFTFIEFSLEESGAFLLTNIFV